MKTLILCLCAIAAAFSISYLAGVGLIYLNGTPEKLQAIQDTNPAVWVPVNAVTCVLSLYFLNKES